MNNRSFQQQQDQMRRNQQAADQSRRTRETMQRQQEVVQRSRENSRRLQHMANRQQDVQSASAPGCGLRLFWMIRTAFQGAILLGLLAIFFTHGGEDPGAIELIVQLAKIGAGVGFLLGILQKAG